MEIVMSASEHLSSLLKMVPVSASHGEPDKHLAFPMDRDVVWDTPDGERVSDAGDSRIQEYTPHISGRQGMLFAPQSITDYRNTPERKMYVNAIANRGVDHHSSQVYSPPVDDYEEDELPEDRSRFREAIRHAISTSRMPTELIRHLPRVGIVYGDDSEFPEGEDDNEGLYKHDERDIHINHQNGPMEGTDDFRHLLLHEIGHAVDYDVNKVKNRDSHIRVIDDAWADPRIEGAAVGFTDRYSIDSEKDNSLIPEDPSVATNYHEYNNANWRYNKGTDVFNQMRRHTRDTGMMPKMEEIDFLSSSPKKPPIRYASKAQHMGEQFYQPTLWDN
jgi:hypothetical protein